MTPKKSPPFDPKLFLAKAKGSFDLSLTALEPPTMLFRRSEMRR